MKHPNENGCYEPEIVEELVRRGRSHASVEMCQCEDGLYRFALDMEYSYGGFGGPIFAGGQGYASPSAAKEAAIDKLLRVFPQAWPGEPKSVHDELREMKACLEDRVRQPSLF